jgi:predicted Kef-type K+ transport protein
VDDILSLILFNVLFSLGDDFNAVNTVVKPAAGVVFMLLAMWAAVKIMPYMIDGKILPLCPEKRDPLEQGARRFRLTKDEMLFFLQMALLVLYGYITHLCGTHLWGCFLAGMSFACLQPAHHAAHIWVKQTKRVTTWMIRIFFSCTVAFSIPVSKLLSLDALWKGLIMGAGPCIATKVLCAPFMGPAKFVIGWAMVGRAEFAYLIAQMALAADMMDEATFSIVIWALLCATIFAPFIFSYLLRKYIETQGLGNEGGSESQGPPHKSTQEALEASASPGPVLLGPNRSSGEHQHIDERSNDLDDIIVQGISKRADGNGTDIEIGANGPADGRGEDIENDPHEGVDARADPSATSAGAGTESPAEEEFHV